jgi:hypothetical protein
MQMRFDGSLGFPGGMVDILLPKDDPFEAKAILMAELLREVKEENNWETDDFNGAGLHLEYRMTEVCEDYKQILHFFSFKVGLKSINFQQDVDYILREIYACIFVPLLILDAGRRVQEDGKGQFECDFK